MQLPSLQRLECPHVSYKTGAFYFDRNVEDLLEQGPSSYSLCIFAFVQRTVEEFRQSRKPTFEIKSRQFV
jgi:hypothetical protein